MNMRRPACAALLLAAALVAPGATRAGDLELSPILVELSARSRTALVTLRNGGSAPMRYQVRAFSWDQKADGGMELTPTRELVLFPPLLELAPGESRNLRVGTQSEPGAAERTWRIFVEELPRADDADAANRVQVLTRVGVPVFLAPTRRLSKVELVFLPPEPGRVRLALRNGGSVRVRPSAVKLALVAADGSPVLEKTLDAWYVLAGGQRIYEVELPEGACAGAATAVASATLESGAIEARAAGACRGP
jgi:fimbrial chaperone protein